MSDFLLHTVVRVQTTVATAVHNLAERLADDERGQDTIEYIGVLLVVAALVAAVALIAKNDLSSTISSGAKKLIKDVFGGA